jgi:hypothetical protein
VLTPKREENALRGAVLLQQRFFLKLQLNSIFIAVLQNLFSAFGCQLFYHPPTPRISR